MNQGGGAVGQEDQGTTTTTTRVVQQSSLFPFFPFATQAVYPAYPYPYQQPYPYPYAPAPMTFTFQVMTEQVASTDSRTFGSWAEALAHARALYTSTRGATRVVITDQSGARRSYPEAVPSPYYPPGFTTPYAYSSLFPSTTTLRVRRTVTVASGELGQGPAFELVDGLQAFPKPLADSIATNLAAMIWVPQGATDPLRSDIYTAYSPGSYEVNFGAPPPAAPGYPGEASAPGMYVLANAASVAPVDALSAGRPLDKIEIRLANRSIAAIAAAPGEDWGVVLAPAAATTIAEKPGISRGAIAAGIAAAVIAGILLFA